MKLRKLAFVAIALLTLGARMAYADEDAGTQLNDASDAGSYAVNNSADGEDASDAAGASFDGTPGGVVQDPGTLEPSTGIVATPNE